MVKESYNIGQLGVVAAFKCHEGAISIVETHGVGGNLLEPHLASPITKDMKVALDGDMAVKPATTTDVVIGVAYANPLDFEINPTQAYTAAQAKAANMLRECSIETIFKKIVWVKCKSGESIAVGDYLEYGSSDIDEFEEADSASDIIALTAIDSDNMVVAGFK